MPDFSTLQVDLHCHSTFSDGRLPPESVAQLMAEAGVQLWSLTDHDTVAGIDRAQAASQALGLNFCSGVEWSTQVGKQPVHLLAYDFDHRHPAISALVAQQNDARQARAVRINEQLMRHANLPDLLAIAQAHAGEGSVGRPHFAQAMVSEGILADTRDAFKRWLGNNKIGDVKTPWADVESIIAAVHQAGGVTMLAHPHKYRLTLSKLRKLIEQLAEFGNDGVELGSPGFREDWAISLVRTLTAHQLTVSRGSDFHFLGSWTKVNQAPGFPEDCQPWWQKRLMTL